MKHKILIVADMPDWIFDYHAHEIKDRLTQYDIDIAYCTQEMIVDRADQYDLIYAMDPFPMRYPCKDKVVMGLRCEWLYQKHPEGATGLYHKGLNGYCSPIQPNCCLLHVVNRSQFKIMKEVVDVPLMLVQHGVNTQLFSVPPMFKKQKKETLTLGMAGNPFSEGEKGQTIMSSLLRTTPATSLRYAAFGNNQTPHESMPAFYNDVDILVCLSKSEGLNNVILEAGAMGVPVISTRVGAAEEIIQHGVNGLLVDRDVESLRYAVKSLRSYRKRQKMGKALMTTVVNGWSWDVRIKDYEEMFECYFNNLQGKK